MAQPKKDKADKYIKQTISFEPNQLNQLIKYCQKEERSISWVIRKALEQYLSKDEI